MTLSISNTIAACYSEPDQFLSSTQLAFSRSVQEFCKESVSCSAILGLALGRTLGILAKSQSVHLFSSYFGTRTARFGSAAIGFAVEGASFHSISNWGVTGRLELGDWNTNLHSALTLALCHGIGKRFSAAGIPIQHLMQNGGIVALDLSFEYFHIVERSNQGIIERFCNAEILSFRMEISAKFLATVCPQVSYIQAKMEIRTTVSERRIEKRDSGMELFGQECATPNGASAEGLKDYLKAEKRKRENDHYSKGEDPDDPIGLLNTVYPGRPSEILEILEQLNMVSTEEIAQARSGRDPFLKLPSWFRELNESIDRFLKGKTVSPEEQTAFRLFVEYTTWTSEGEWSSQSFPLLYDRSFARLKKYFVALVRFTEDQIEYAQKTSRTTDSIHVEKARFLAHRILTRYLGRRDTASSTETFISSVRQSAREISESQRCTKGDFFLFVEKKRLYLDFLSRRIADDEALMAEWGNLIKTHFPLADYYKLGEENRISWEEIEAIRREHLPPSIEKPTLMIVGIGAEWNQVVQYAEAGYHLVLVDRSEIVADFFRSKKEGIEELERIHEVTIRYIQEDIESLSAKKEFEGSIDCIEYQNAKGIANYDELALIDSMLKPGGLFVQFNPEPINLPEPFLEREREYAVSYAGTCIFNKYDYKIILDRANIPGVLNTLSERLAYPLGNYLLMVQKTGEKSTHTSPIEPKPDLFRDTAPPALPSELSSPKILEVSAGDDLFTQLPPWLIRLHQLSDQVVAEHSTHSTEERDIFRFFAEYTTLVNEEALTLDEIRLLYRTAFPRWRNYFSTLRVMVHQLTDYLEATRSEESFKKERQNYLFDRLIASYLARREIKGPEEPFYNSADEGIGTIFTLSKAASLGQVVISGNTLLQGTRYLDFLMRKVAANDELIRNYAKVIGKHFPLVDYYREGRKKKISWEEVERIRKKHFLNVNGKLTLMIVGIGAEWDQVVRYAQEGYDLVLVDPSDLVESFFKERESEIKKLEDAHQIKIVYEKKEIESDELVNSYENAIDCIEFQNTVTIKSERAVKVDKMLKKGGIFVQFNPLPIGSPEQPFEEAFQWSTRHVTTRVLDQLNYAVVLEEKNIPGLLGTTSERLAYPLGNYLYIAKKL